MPGDEDDQQTTDDQSASESTQSDEQTSQDPATDERMEGDTGAAPQKGAKKGDCSGWERDPESFAKRVADHYIRTELGREPPLVKHITCGPADLCVVDYIDGEGIWVWLDFIPDHVSAQGSGQLEPRRDYDYDCTPSGELVFTKRS
jgi:hypothetical protein